jgi:hypothetical protein
MPNPCKVVLDRDGSIYMTVHPAPGYTLEEAWQIICDNDRLPQNEHPVGYDELQRFDLDDDQFPPEYASCATCGREHPTRDLWVVRA